jgi:hypothetical protein
MFKRNQPSPEQSETMTATADATHDKLVDFLQRSLKGFNQFPIDAMRAALDVVVVQELWRSRVDAKGIKFDSFADFAVHPAPQGLELRSSSELATLRGMLIKNGHLREWAELLHRVSRGPGRPKTFAAGEEFHPFHSPPTGSNSVDRILLRLQDCDCSLFERVCAGELSVRAAAIAKGWVANTQTVTYDDDRMMLPYSFLEDLPSSALLNLARQMLSMLPPLERRNLVAEFATTLEKSTAIAEHPPDSPPA